MKRIIVGLSLFTFLALGTKAQEVVVIKQDKKDTTDKPLMVIDGVIQENKNMNDFSPSDIKSVNVIKGPLAKDKYGKKGETGVVEITTKKITKPTRVGVEVDTSNMTIIVNGDQVLLNGEKVDPNDPRLKKIKMIKVSGGPKAPEAPMNKAFLGVSTKSTSEGAEIVEVSEESPAAKAGLEENDVITQVDKDPIKSHTDLYAAIGKHKEGDKITIEYLRDGKKNKKEIVLAKNTVESREEVFEFVPDNFNQNFNRDFNKNFRKGFALPNLPNLEEIYVNTKKPKLGISIEDLEEGSGVKIKAVTDGSPAAKAGLKVGDIINNIDKHEVKEVNDIKWQYFDAGQTLKLGIIRNKEVKTIEVKIPKKINSADL
ncbi:MAG: PDZ domain-containing protein [Sediminibacterium sp.]